ncbi:hypothetical protein UAY_02960 [Enterococcus moraviensis ATCC BAA-383]|uniref:site-specific DNA-methyltransferase (adenine-specific) n=1 Tax=Enterococcus moraviensis ATCC BAA-383 TaxID=1158609 RepID=R2QJ01_9ENTE|nr:N-6 DNA methylase [Enterococcus moraviensis]EOH96592.1 hypothetical protein UAY_02960 [Enterococcus moraviensis ATCC BAA-383]EOT66018.1 hypothetical protein I586_02287 [Enterococcus moraviensis ATCC BAA-383]OJG68210.1 hypothetical protein RV09_GL001457 [Enterococcus moraviensis]
MSEQTIQNNLYSENVKIGEKYICLSLGATTISDLIKSKTIKSYPISNNIKNKKPDVLILDSNREVIVYQEQKIPQKFKSEKDIQKAINQEIYVAKELNAKIFVVSDGDSFIWINPQTGNRILNENEEEILLPVSPKKNAEVLEKLILEISESVNEQNDIILKKEYIDPTDLAIKINGVLKNLTFASSKMALYTFVEVFLFKYLSDIEILKGENSFDYIYRLYGVNGIPQYDDATILGKYSDGAREQMRYLFPEGEDGTTIINGQIFHVEKRGGEYFSPDNTDFVFKQVILEFKQYEKKAGQFKYISKDFKSKLFETFMKNNDEKSEMGQFFTPLKIVQGMVSMVDIKPKMKICDPASGVGKFLLEAIDDNLDNYFKVENGEFQSNISLTGYEKMMSDGDDITVILAKANMLIYCSKLFQNNKDNISKIADKLLNGTFKVFTTALGTLDKIEENSYDLILANPPYYQSKVMSQKAKETGQYKLGGLGVEAIFLEWIMKSLKPGGVANVVLPDGIFSNESNRKLKQFLIKNCFVESIISLPVDTFFNTPKKTYILTIRKKTTAELKSSTIQAYPIFAYLCKSIGETLDVYRFDIDDNDLSNAIEKYNHYRKLDYTEREELKEPFKSYFSEDAHLKLIDVQSFNPDESWIIENWWSDDEKVSLGFEEEVITLSISEYQEILTDTIDIINSFKEELEWLKNK